MVRIAFSVWLASCYARVFALLSVVIATIPVNAAPTACGVDAVFARHCGDNDVRLKSWRMPTAANVHAAFGGAALKMTKLSRVQR